MAGKTMVTEMLVLEICDDIGTCWHDVGIKLGLSAAILRNIDSEREKCREKAREMLYKWMNEKGDSATLQCLTDALEKIKQTKIAQKLLGTYIVLFQSSLLLNLIMISQITKQLIAAQPLESSTALGKTFCNIPEKKKENMRSTRKEKKDAIFLPYKTGNSLILLDSSKDAKQTI